MQKKKHTSDGDETLKVMIPLAMPVQSAALLEAVMCTAK